MKRFHSLLLMAFCLLAACEPSPPSSATPVVRLGAGSVQAFDLKSNNIVFTDQPVCGTSAAQRIEVWNDDTSKSRQLSFAEATGAFVLTSVEDKDGNTLSLPLSLGPDEPDNRVFFLVKFSPRIPDSYTGSLNIFSDDPASPLEISLSGKGTGPRLELSPSSLTLSLPTGTSGVRVAGAEEAYAGVSDGGESDAGVSDAGVADAGVSGDGGTPLASDIGTVHLKNSGNAPLTSLTLSPVVSSFSVKLSRPVTPSAPLEPGGTVDLVVTFDPTTSEPIVTDTLVVTSDDPCAPTFRIPLTGVRNAGPTPVVTPTALTFAEQEVGTISAPQSVKVSNGGGSVLTVDSITLQDASDAGTPFIVSPSGAFSLAPGESRDLSVKFSPTTAGHQQATLQLASSSGGSFPSIALSGDAVAAAPLVIKPSSIVFSNQAPGQEQTQKISVENSGSSEVTVTATVATTDTFLTLNVNPASSFTLAPKAIQELVVSSKPSSSAVTGPLSGLLTLSSGATTRFSRQTLIPISGNIVRTRVVPSPTTLSFEPQVVGAPAQSKELVLRNPTELPVMVYAVAASSLGPYSVTGLPVEIPAKGDAKVMVSFDPTSRKQWDATLQLTSDAPDAIAPVTLSGKAIAPVLSVVSPSTLSLDFGTRAPGTETPLPVTLKNDGDADLSLTNIDFLDPKHFTLRDLIPPRVIKPGDSVLFNVVFKPQDLGDKGTVLRFYLNNSLTPLPSPQVNLKATSSGPVVTFDPGKDTGLGFGPRRVGDSSVLPAKVRIFNALGAPEAVELVSVSIKGATPEFTLVGTYVGLQAKGGEFLDVWVNFKPTTVGRDYSDTLVIEYRGTTTRASNTTDVPLTGRGATALLDVNPYPSVAFGAVELNQAGARDITITNKGESPLKLISISIGGASAASFLLGQVSWPRELAKNETETIPVSFVPTKLDAVTADLVITSNATSSNVDSTGKTTVLLSGRGAAARALFATRTLGFGEVPIGTTKTISLLVTNTGSSPLRIDEPTPSDHFKIRDPRPESEDKARGWPVIIPVKAAGVDNSYTFQVDFHPETETAVSETLTFKSNDTVESSTQVTVTGVGTRPLLSVSSPITFVMDANDGGTGSPPASDGGTGSSQWTAPITLTNNGQAPLIIESLIVDVPFCIVIPSSTGCVQKTAPGFSLTIDSQNNLDLELQVTPTSPLTKGTLVITTNEGGTASPVRSIPLSIGTEGAFLPNQLVDFGVSAMDGSSTSQVIKVLTPSNTGALDDAIIDVSFGGPDKVDFGVVSALVPPLPVPKKGSAELKLSFKPRNGAAGLRQARAYVYTQLNRKTPLEFDVQGVAMGPFSGFKDFRWSVDFGTQRLSEKKAPVIFPLTNQIDRTIYVKSYAVEGADTNDFVVTPGVSCRQVGPAPQQLEIRMGETCQLELSYVADRAKPSSAVLVLEAGTGAGDALIPSTRVGLKGEMVSSILSADSPEVDFGWVDLGQPIEPKLITVTNRSSVATRVLVPEVTLPEVFTVEALEPGRELPPGGVTQLRVTFHPQEPGEPTGQLLLRLQGEAVTDLTIGLKGQVLAVRPGGGGCSSAASEGAPLWMGGLLLIALGARRRSRQGSRPSGG